jgi:bifunctional non-homologous end joining protein LigD
LPGGDLMIDGEAIVQRPNGHCDFDALKTRSGAASAVLIGFDLLRHDGQELRRDPLEARRARLAALIGHHPALQYSESIEGDGAEIFRYVAAMGLEGIVSKRLGKAYSPGRCAHWIKTKAATFVRR